VDDTGQSEEVEERVALCQLRGLVEAAEKAGPPQEAAGNAKALEAQDIQGAQQWSLDASLRPGQLMGILRITMSGLTMTRN
jgi:hypothetical protein